MKKSAQALKEQNGISFIRTKAKDGKTSAFYDIKDIHHETSRQRDYSACSMYKGICHRITDECNLQKTIAD